MIHADTNLREAIMKITEQGQITIPKELREKYGLREDVELEFIQAKGGLFIQTREAADRAAKPPMIQLMDEGHKAWLEAGGATPEDIMEQRRKEGLHPVEQISGIIGYLGPEIDFDQYMDEIRGRCICGRCIC